jgi:hypothetical protein
MYLDSAPHVLHAELRIVHRAINSTDDSQCNAAAKSHPQFHSVGQLVWLSCQYICVNMCIIGIVIKPALTCQELTWHKLFLQALPVLFCSPRTRPAPKAWC